MAIIVPSSASSACFLQGNTAALTNVGLSLALDFRNSAGASCTEVATSQLSRYSIQVTCVSGTIGALQLEHSWDLVNWDVVDATTFVGMTAGQSKSLENTDNARPYFRVRAQSSGATGEVLIHMQGHTR